MVEAFSRPARRLREIDDFSAASLRASGDETVSAHPAMMADWRTVLEPTAGTVAYAFAPPRSPGGKHAEEDAQPLAVGCKRLSAQGWSAFRAVVRPSDILTAARALSTAEEGVGNGGESDAGGREEGEGNGGQAEREQSSVDGHGGLDTSRGACGTVNTAELVAASWTTVGEENISGGFSVAPLSRQHVSEDQHDSLTPVDLDVRVSGPGMSLRLEDDSGTHFISPPRRVAGETPPIGSVLQPVVEAKAGAWEFTYSRMSPSGSDRQTTVVGAQDDADTCRVESARLSMLDFTATDLLQTGPCHSAFRELLVIAAPPVLQTPLPPSRGALSEQETQAPQTIPITSDYSRRGEGVLGEDGGTSGPSVGSGLGKMSLNEPLSRLPPTASTASHGASVVDAGRKDAEQLSPSGLPAVLVEYRKVLSLSSMSRSSGAAGYAQAPAESSGEQGASSSTAGARRRSSYNTGGVSSDGTAPAAAAAECAPSLPVEIASRATVNVDLGGSITANWNPRTLPALWGVRAALSSALAVSGSSEPLDSDTGGTVKGVGARDRSGKIDGGVVPSSCATEIRVGARHGIKVR